MVLSRLGLSLLSCGWVVLGCDDLRWCSWVSFIEKLGLLSFFNPKGSNPFHHGLVMDTPWPWFPGK